MFVLKRVHPPTIRLILFLFLEQTSGVYFPIRNEDINVILISWNMTPNSPIWTFLQFLTIKCINLSRTENYKKDNMVFCVETGSWRVFRLFLKFTPKITKKVYGNLFKPLFKIIHSFNSFFVNCMNHPHLNKLKQF